MKHDNREQYSHTVCLFADCRIHHRCQLLPVACWCVGCEDPSLLSTGTIMASPFLHLTLVLIIHLSQYIDGNIQMTDYVFMIEQDK